MKAIDQGSGSLEPLDPPVRDVIEAEWQFDAADLGPVERWLIEGWPTKSAMSIHFSLSAGTPREIRDTYLDTPDFRIFRAGYALRMRRSGSGAEATMKALGSQPGDLAVRREITQRLDSVGVEAILKVGGPIAERLRLLRSDTRIQTLVEIHTHRRAYVLRAREKARDEDSGDGKSPDALEIPIHANVDRFAAGQRSAFAREEAVAAPSAEVAFDQSAVTDGQGRTHRLSRIEIETTPEGLEVYRDLATRMREECGLELAGGSKLEWALQASGIQVDRTMSLGPGTVDPTMNVGRIAFAVLRKQCASFLWHEPGTRLGEDPEQLHDMRVASRRMRAALRLYKEVFQPGEADRLRGQLAMVARHLGEVRDLDVFTEKLGGLIGELSSVNTGACAPLLARLSDERDEARRTLIDALESPAYEELKGTLTARIIAGPEPGMIIAERPILIAGPDLIRRCRRRAMRLARSLRPDSPASDYHALRIRCKRFRYALEFLEGLYGPPARNMIEVLVEIQDALGFHQDAQVSLGSLRSMTEEKPASFTAETYVALGELTQIYQARARELRSRIPRLLRRLRGKRWRRLKLAMDEMARVEGGKIPTAEKCESPVDPSGASAPGRKQNHTLRADDDQV